MIILYMCIYIYFIKEREKEIFKNKKVKMKNDFLCVILFVIILMGIIIIFKLK